MPGYVEQISDPAKLVPKELAAELHLEVERAYELLCRLPEPMASWAASGKWSAKQVVGHLIDSAANNLHRFVRLQIEPDLKFPPYRQEEWVAVQCYSVMPWMQALETWKAFNVHLAHVIQHIKPEHLTRIWHYEDAELTLGYLIEDYIAHLRHHLKQLPKYGV